ncbi:CBS domain-containing protein [Myxococcus sp. RHSTA-1-4]|uniref:CBS domain-containing protein n=1 Tax=Myxococcus sp. RHSTA-1-4 TaxID=2874601 RepID=UPI001CBE7EA1|nr:CBS domain-containing protein [Myxococcus sp. RHSTA-1-4]MBZ4420267.1 CBS domain-containing protein [Myxococcus sp. RHSTA-1-4]
MRQDRAFKEALSSFIATVFPTDTLLRALREMERHQVRMLGVVGEGGGLLGLVSESHILAAWGGDPLAPVSEVMARVTAPPRERPRLRLLLPRLRRKPRGLPAGKR